MIFVVAFVFCHYRPLNTCQLSSSHGRSKLSGNFHSAFEAPFKLGGQAEASEAGQHSLDRHLTHGNKTGYAIVLRLIRRQRREYTKQLTKVNVRFGVLK